jgi:ribosomal protein RSM22 (predicted rRNA methylase)
MMQTFINLPEEIKRAISQILGEQENTQWLTNTVKLHERYMPHEKYNHGKYIENYPDALAYLALRVPATYAQIYSALLQIQEVLPSWTPASMLDIGSGPGSGIWAAKTLWPGIMQATCLEQEKHFLWLGRKILELSPLLMDVSWRHQDILAEIEETITGTYDLIIIANVLNELPPAERAQLIDRISHRNRGVMLILEPGTPQGFQIIQAAAKNNTQKRKLIAPYIPNTFVSSDRYWLHFPQRFVRPDFLRRVRQNMRDSSLMASDWEETKYSYVAFSTIEPEKIWGRSVGPVVKQKGYLEMTILTTEGVMPIRVMKRHKKEYTFAKNLQWGEIIRNEEDLISLS